MTFDDDTNDTAADGSEFEGLSAPFESSGLPEGSRIEVVEAGDSRAVVVIPAGGQSSGFFGIFAFLWNVLVAGFTALLWFADKGEEGIPLFAIGIIVVFWIAGGVLSAIWIRLRFTRTLLLLERRQIAVQTILFGRKSIDETDLTPESSADLVASYTMNDEPVYRIDVQGRDGVVKFGTRLAHNEKEWLADSINLFLESPG